MFDIKVTGGIIHKINEINKAFECIKRTDLSSSIKEKIKEDSKIDEAWASNRIEGNPLCRVDAIYIIEEKRKNKILFRPEQEIANYYNAINYLEERVKAHESLSVDMILHAQRLVEEGDRDKIGFRGATKPGVLFGVFNSITGLPVYIPPDCKEVQELVDDLVAFVNTANLHPLVIAATAHYQLVTIHPFWDGNGRTARLTTKYILDYFGYNFGDYVSISKEILNTRSEYYKSIQMNLPAPYYGGRNNPPEFHIWLEYFLDVCLECLKNAIVKVGGEEDEENC